MAGAAGAGRRGGAAGQRRAGCGTRICRPLCSSHGLGGSSLNWTALGLLLNDTVRGIAPDLPGFGRTPPSRVIGGISEQADVLIQLMEREFDQPVHVFGNSMGGAPRWHWLRSGPTWWRPSR